MMKRSRFACGVLALATLLSVPSGSSAQLMGLQNGEWRYLGGDAGHTRFSPLNQINASNFSKLKVAWIFRGDNFGPGIEYTARSTPIYVNGVLYTVLGQRRQVVAIDAGTGETRWVFREPDTSRYLRSPRTDFGKGVAYAEVYQGLAAYDMNTGEKLWDLPVGKPPERIRNHPLLKGVDVSSFGGTGNQIVMGDLLVQTTEDLRSDAEVNDKGMPLVHARDKRTGKILASVALPMPGEYGMMTYMHEGKQYIIVQSGSAKRNQPGSLVALTLP